eukprot:609494-Rhodomonas_salina.2
MMLQILGAQDLTALQAVLPEHWQQQQVCYAICLRARYALSGTDMTRGGTSRQTCRHSTPQRPNASPHRRYPPTPPVWY